MTTLLTTATLPTFALGIAVGAALMYLAFWAFSAAENKS